MEMKLSGGKSGQGRDGLFIAAKGGRRTVQGGWSAAVVWIQCFDFGSRGKATGQNVAER
jgi:hypothetical protein